MSEELQEPMKGAFMESLKRNNKQIRADRAEMIGKQARMRYRRVIEDLEMSIDQMKQEQINMLDMSPTDAQSLIVASDFSADEYTRKDVELGVKIRQEEIKLEIAVARYKHLFGEEI
jgi:hypothetical protein